MSTKMKVLLGDIAYVVATVAVFALIGVLLAWRG